jgi:hypothetical protein
LALGIPSLFLANGSFLRTAPPEVNPVAIVFVGCGFIPRLRVAGLRLFELHYVSWGKPSRYSFCRERVYPAIALITLSCSATLSQFRGGASGRGYG